MRRVLSLMACGLMLAVALALSPATHAQEKVDPPEGQALYDKGRIARDAGRFAEAEAALKQSVAVREAALDLKAIQRRIRDAGHLAYEWYPAQASARTKMATLSLAHGADRERLPRNQGGLPHCTAKEVSLAGQSEPWSHQKNGLPRRARDGCD